MTNTYMTFLPTADRTRSFSLNDTLDEADECFELKFWSGATHRFHATEIEVLRYMCNQALARHNARVDASHSTLEDLGLAANKLKFPICTCVKEPNSLY